MSEICRGEIPLLSMVVIIARGGIGSGAVVTKSTEPDGLYLGVPAKRVRDLD